MCIRDRVQGGEALNQTKLFLFNHNSRRIIDLITLIVVQLIFITAKIYAKEVNLSYPGPSIQNLLPLIIHIVLFLNVVYNSTMLILEVVHSRKSNSPKVENDFKGEGEGETNERFNKSMYTQSPKKKVEEDERTKDAGSTLGDSMMRTTNNKLIIKNNANANSMYDLKRPQILRLDKNKRRRDKNRTQIEDM